MSFNVKEFEKKKETVNRAIGICIECGSRSIEITNHEISCKDCNSTFRIEDEN